MTLARAQAAETDTWRMARSGDPAVLDAQTCFPPLIMNIISFQFLESIPSHAIRAMMFLSFLLPLVVHYVLIVLPLAVGLLAFARTRPGLGRHRWIFVTGLLAVLGGSLVMVQGKAALVGAADDASWFIVLMGLLPMALGGVSLIRWSRL